MRYIYDKSVDSICGETDNSVGVVCSTIDDVVDLLNEQQKQIQKLRCDLESRSQDDYVEFLKNENKRLRELVEEADDIICSQCTSYYQRQWQNHLVRLMGEN